MQISTRNSALFLQIIFSIVALGSGFVKQTSINRKLPAKTVLSSHQAIRDSSILYATCATPRNLFSNELDCTLFREKINFKNTSELSECKIPLKIDDGVIDLEKIRVMRFGEDEAIVGWNQLNKKLSFWQSIVDLVSCKITETDKVEAAGVVRSSRDALSEYAIKKDSFELIYRRSISNFSDLSKVTFNKDGNVVEDMTPWIKTDEKYITDLHVNAAAGEKKHLVLLKSLSVASPAAPFVGTAYRIEDDVSKTEQTMIKPLYSTGDQPDVSMISSNSHDTVGFCFHFNRKTICSQYGAKGQLSLKTTLSFDYRVYDTAMMNLATGGFLLLTTKCPEELTGELRCVYTLGSQHEITKVDETGRKVGELRLNRPECDLNNYVARAQFFERGGDYCLTWMCHAKGANFEDTNLSTSVTCFSDRDLAERL